MNRIADSHQDVTDLDVADLESVTSSLDLLIAHDQSRSFDAEDLRVMANLTHFAAAAYAALTRQVAVRADVSSALASEDSLPGILKSCTEAVVRHLDAAFAGIWVTTKDKRVLELQASAGMYTNLDGAHNRIPVGHLEIGRIAEERTPCNRARLLIQYN